MPINKRYSKEGVLNANKTITKLVTQWLSKNKFTKDDWMKQNFTAVIRYINLNLKVGNTVHNLASQYGSFETYLSYLIKDIEPGVMKENKAMKLVEIVKKYILKEEILEPHPYVFGSDIDIYDEDERQLDTKSLIKISKFWKIKPGWIGIYQSPDTHKKFKVQLLGFGTEGHRGRIAAFKVLDSKYKGTYMIIDALTDGSSIK